MSIFAKRPHKTRKPHPKTLGEPGVAGQMSDQERRDLEYQLNFHMNRRISL
ncbi:hypothetical protein [Celeribacter neptunius]|uniref:Uncharacterized protein n=1 Tax=Celeribacter neptunius TaxID=588602 RepID=A0A1I3SJS7_9RHOB|nr:hypothetical protein [Celeribacter neptunius]SFJ57696.1 hypothetical protein SAMN04487991_2458 [Celeribacter neptunius]